MKLEPSAKQTITQPVPIEQLHWLVDLGFTGWVLISEWKLCGENCVWRNQWMGVVLKRSWYLCCYLRLLSTDSGYVHLFFVCLCSAWRRLQELNLPPTRRKPSSLLDFWLVENITIASSFLDICGDYCWHLSLGKPYLFVMSCRSDGREWGLSEEERAVQGRTAETNRSAAQ